MLWSLWDTVALLVFSLISVTWSISLRVDRNEAVLSDTVLADGTGEEGAVGVDPMIDAGPAVEMAASGHHWLMAYTVADVALKGVHQVFRRLVLLLLVHVLCN